MMPRILDNALALRRPWVLGATAGLVPLAVYLVQSYRGFLALGPSGVPHSLAGWLLQLLAKPLADLDGTDPAPFRARRARAEYAPHDSFGALSELAPRDGSRPTVPSYTVPQRQTSQGVDMATITRMNAWLLALARHNPALLALRASNLEHRDSPSLWLNVDSPGVALPSFLASGTRGEIVHVHNEGSSHMVLSLGDAELATRRGWAQRHALSGRCGILPVSYVLVYAPRDDDELEQWKAFVRAAVGFVSAGAGVKVDYAFEDSWVL